MTLTVGCFLPSHFPLSAVDEIYQVTKKNGLVFIHARDAHLDDKEYGLASKLEEMVAQGKLRFMK